MCNVRALLDCTLTIIEPTVDYDFHEICEFRNFSVIKSSVSTLGDTRIKKWRLYKEKSYLVSLKDAILLRVSQRATANLSFLLRRETSLKVRYSEELWSRRTFDVQHLYRKCGRNSALSVSSVGWWEIHPHAMRAHVNLSVLDLFIYQWRISSCAQPPLVQSNPILAFFSEKTGSDWRIFAPRVSHCEGNCKVHRGQTSEHAWEIARGSISDFI